MEINIAIIGCDLDLKKYLQPKVSKGNLSFIDLEDNKMGLIEKYDPVSTIVFCNVAFFNQLIQNERVLTDFSYLLYTDINSYVQDVGDCNVDCIRKDFSYEEFNFRVKNLLRYQRGYIDLTDKNEKLRKFFDKNRNKTIDLFGKHVDLKKAKKEIDEQKKKIEIQNAVLEASFEKKKRKTIDLFGKHIDLKKAQKEIAKKNQIMERVLEKNKQKTLDLFGKHVDLKKAQKEIAKKNELLEKVLEKNKQKTLDLFGKHVDLKKAQKEIVGKNAQIEKQNKAIKDSINYASFIQSAVMPKDEKIDELLKEHMIIYMPRDIVSGDFYWVDKIDDYLFIVAADCTGHGVPGAFMSMLGISLLNELVPWNVDKTSNEILEKLRKKVIFSLHQTGKIDEAADGMDLAFCKINIKKREVDFAGAHNPLYIIRDSEIIEIKGDRMPIGYSLRMNKQFSNTIFQLQENDRLYMFSDGYADQFGGEKGMKMRYKFFQQHLLDSCKMDFGSQKEYLIKMFHEWKGDYNQIDDVVVLGFQI